MDNFWIIAIGFMAIILYHTVRWFLGMKPDLPSQDSDDGWHISSSDDDRD
ncbi:hypothetical protein GV829_08670 [Sphingomonas lacunae]|uniref:Uncharacterized protein n=1 Tax=Sphingomonas lacunae TaxID=2698828 RepID=A0A6M4AW31_9SPHN|nr:hypothetical protein [Sphingomonas lacunae]QJQ32512.1 hypothetical protein GV829_08670 [Sphingomonas lacunae]